VRSGLDDHTTATHVPTANPNPNPTNPIITDPNYPPNGTFRPALVSRILPTDGIPLRCCFA